MNEKTLNKAIAIGTLISFVAAAIVYAHTTFSTINYVDQKHTQVKEDLRELKDGQKEIHQMLREIWQRGRR